MILYREFFMIHQLKAEGLNHSQIARRLGVDRKTVRMNLQCDRNDLEALRRQPRPSNLDPYRPYLCRHLRCLLSRVRRGDVLLCIMPHACSSYC